MTPARIKLSELAKRDEIRAWPIRDTVISRWYRGRTVYRNIKEGSMPITGSFYTPDASNTRAIVHTDLDNPAGIPCATWWLVAADYTWETYRPVDNDLHGMA